VSQASAQPTRHPRRFSALLTSAVLVAALVPASAIPVTAEPEPAPASAGSFMYFKHPASPVCTLSALNVSAGPFFKRSDCGFATFAIAPATSTAQVRVDFIGPDGTVFHNQNGTFRTSDSLWQILIRPTASWPAGSIEARVTVDGEPAGSSSFGHNMLGATLAVDPDGEPYAPGDDLPVTGNVHELDNMTNLAGPSRTGVPASFSLAVVTPSGDVRAAGGPFTADAEGDFSATVDGSLTADLTPSSTGLEIVAAIAVVDASRTNPSTGAWAAEEAGRQAVTLLAAADALQLEASFVSSTGWVKPGDTYPFRVFVTNPTGEDATGVTVTLSAPPSATFVDATSLTDGQSAATTPTSITWEVGTLPAATEAGPMSATLVVTARAATLGEDDEVVWKDLSTAASLTYDGHAAAIGASTHGPKVIPPAGGFETARYGDKPFPIVPVEYLDLERQSNADFDNDSEKLDTVVNDPAFVGSTFNLYQEMSFGQLFPEGTVPSAAIASADFSSYEPGFDFTTPAATDATCRGVTLESAPDTIGSPLFDARIQDGWYQLPGNTEYYGGDFPAFTANLTGGIDSACGPLGKAVFDAAQIADPEIDYNGFDSDKDGVVDFFMLVFVGCGGNGPSQLQVNCEYFGSTPPYDNIWPHSSSLEGQYKDAATGLRGYISDDQLRNLTEVPQCWTSELRRQFDDCAATGGTGLDGLPVYVRVGPYNVNPETVFQSASVISHEYGHHLGLPDFYDASGEVYGDLNLMAADYSQHMTIFSKQELGWVVPDFLQPGQTLNVNDWNEIKADTGVIHWQTPNGTSYTLSAAGGDQNIHNGQAYGLKLPGRQLIDPEKVATQASATHVWHSGRGNDFGCSPTRGHNLDLYLPELSSMAPGTNVTLQFKSSWDIEWDWDFGFVLTTPDGETYTSQPSIPGYTTDNAFNPNRIECQADLNNGLTGTSGAYQQGPAVVTVARVPGANDYSHGSPFLLDSYDVSELAGQPNPVVRFSYFTDGAFDRPGWFIDDIEVRAGGEVIYSSDFETDDEADRLFPGGCRADGGRVTATCTDGWSRIAADEEAPLDHAYYLELRDQSGFDFDGHNQSERGDTSWLPGLFVEYTDEAHGYGNNGTPPPPAQHYIDSQPIPGSDCVSEQNGNCADVSFTSTAGDDRFSDSKTADQPEGFINSFENPDSTYGDDLWHFDYGCLTLDVTTMLGEDIGPEDPATGNLSADATITAGEVDEDHVGCAPFAYGRTGDGVPNQAPTAVAQARPTEAATGEPITFDGSGSTDDRQAPEQLTYSWDFADGTPEGEGQVVHHAFATAGTYEVTLTVTDADGATDTATVKVTITGRPNLQVTAIQTVQNTGAGGNGNAPREGDKVVIRGTVANMGDADAPASTTAFELDGSALAGSPVATSAIPAGEQVTVELDWDTRGVKGAHTIRVTADADGDVGESSEADNSATLEVTVKGNKVTNGDFEQANAEGTGPEAWSGSSEGAGTTSWSEEGGTAGSHGAAASGNGGNATLLGVPTWTSDPIDVAPGEALSLRVTVSTEGVSSAPAVGLAYLGAAGELLSTVRLIDVPIDTAGFTTLERAVTLPPGVAQVRVVLFGFSPTDPRTAGMVVFDDIGLFEE